MARQTLIKDRIFRHALKQRLVKNDADDGHWIKQPVLHNYKHSYVIDLLYYINLDFLERMESRRMS